MVHVDCLEFQQLLVWVKYSQLQTILGSGVQDESVQVLQLLVHVDCLEFQQLLVWVKLIPEQTVFESGVQDESAQFEDGLFMVMTVSEQYLLPEAIWQIL